jgi:predicted outer membrane repeat protein
MGRALVKTCKRAWAGAARPAFIVALLVLVPIGVVLIRSLLRAVPPPPPNIITVNTLIDPGTTGVCALRDAITAANTLAAVNGCPAGTGTDTIHFSVSGTITLGSTLPTILNTLTIDGIGQAITVSGAVLYEILYENAAATVTLNELTLTDGKTNDFGGAIFNDGGMLTVTNSTFSGSSAPGGGAIYEDSGSLTVSSSTFSGNTAATFGGAIFALGTVNVTNSTFSANTAGEDGGPSLSMAR